MTDLTSELAYDHLPAVGTHPPIPPQVVIKEQKHKPVDFLNSIGCSSHHVDNLRQVYNTVSLRDLTSFVSGSDTSVMSLYQSALMCISLQVSHVLLTNRTN